MKEMKLFTIGLVLLVCFAGFALADVNETNVSVENETNVSVDNVSLDDIAIVSEGDVNVTNESDVNVTEEVNVSVENESDEANVTNESVVLEPVVDVADEETENVVIDDDDGDLEIVVSPRDDPAGPEEDSAFDELVAYAKAGIDKVNSVHENLFYVLVIVVVILIMLVHTVFFGNLSAATCFARASRLHKKAEKAHVNGNYERAQRLYNKSYSLREKGEEKAQEED